MLSDVRKIVIDVFERIWNAVAYLQHSDTWTDEDRGYSQSGQLRLETRTSRLRNQSGNKYMMSTWDPFDNSRAQWLEILLLQRGLNSGHLDGGITQWPGYSDLLTRVSVFNLSAGVLSWRISSVNGIQFLQAEYCFKPWTNETNKNWTCGQMASRRNSDDTCSHSVQNIVTGCQGNRIPKNTVPLLRNV
jgi:hypothetical protein